MNVNFDIGIVLVLLLLLLLLLLLARTVVVATAVVLGAPTSIVFARATSPMAAGTEMVVVT